MAVKIKKAEKTLAKSEAPPQVKKAGGSTLSVASLMATFQKDKGEGIGQFGAGPGTTERCPTSLFELDSALGGGFPRGKVIMIYGPESSGKTNIALLTIAAFQRAYPELTCAFVDMENAFDGPWASTLGVDVERLAVFKPSYAEEATDIIENLLCMPDIGIIVYDSLAAAIRLSETKSDPYTQTVGGLAGPMSGLVRRTTAKLLDAAKEGRFPTLIYINQVTFKIAQNGDPETTVGGAKPRYQAAILLRVYGKNIKDASINKDMPIMKEINFIVRKWKCPILTDNGKINMVTHAHKGLEPGQSADYGRVLDYLRSFGEVEDQKGKGWKILGEVYPKQDDFKAKFYGDRAFGDQVRAHVITTIANLGELVEEGGKS